MSTQGDDWGTLNYCESRIGICEAPDGAARDRGAAGAAAYPSGKSAAAGVSDRRRDRLGRVRPAGACGMVADRAGGGVRRTADLSRARAARSRPGEAVGALL